MTTNNSNNRNNRVNKNKKSTTMMFLDNVLNEEMSFANMLHTYRECEDFTIEKLAALASMSPKDVLAIEQNKLKPKLEQAAKLGEALGYTGEHFVKTLFEEQLRKANLNYAIEVRAA